MTLIQDANRLNTANQLKSWNDNAINNMSIAKQNYDSIAAQKIAMENNPEYTEEDILEVEKLLINLNALATSLTY